MPEQTNEISFNTRDEYQRKPIASKVIQLLISDTKVSPMVIDGSWGTGKTEFCNKLIHLIENGDSGFRTVYIDAFKADHADEPLMTLLAAVLKIIPDADRPSLIQKALPAIRFGAKATLKAGVSWVLRQDAVDLKDDLEQELKKIGDDAINKTIESLLTDHIAAEESIKTLKDSLRKVAIKKPIVVFIDELDRCRPDFAVAILESIKHIFEVEGVQFVLITNSEQLRASINHCYGSAIDAQRYLDKFLGFQFIFPETFKPNGHNEILASTQHLKTSIDSSEILADSYLQTADGLFSQLITHNQMSLREVETFVRYLEIYQILTNGSGFRKNTAEGYRLLKILGVYLYCFKDKSANSLTGGIIDGPEIVKVMGITEYTNLLDNSYPSETDIVAVMVMLESTYGKDNFINSTDKLMQTWNGIIYSLFSREPHHPRTGERMKIVKSVIDTLKLNQ